MNIIGIDPGANGGIAMVTPNNEWTADRFPKDREPRSVKKLFNSYVRGNKCRVYIELVHAMPMDARSSAFKFGMNYGIWLGLSAYHVTTKITPQTWQSIYGELSKEKTKRKNELKKIASDISGVPATLATADAILIANYGLKRKEE
tara:strand:- start:1994 stop:2431 length:438 start_codon:yes stop_codon:yes gene_type:complete